MTIEVKFDRDAVREYLVRVANDVLRDHGIRITEVRWTWVPPQPEYELGEWVHCDQFTAKG